MKNLIVILSISGLIFFACNNNQDTDSGIQSSEKPPKLHIKDYNFSVLDKTGKFIPYDKAIYQRGDEVLMVLSDVGPFHRGTDSLNRAEMKMEIFNTLGEKIISRENLFGERGHADFENDILKNPYASYQTDIKDKIGRYTFKVTIYDLIAGDSTSIQENFTIE